MSSEPRSSPNSPGSARNRSRREVLKTAAALTTALDDRIGWMLDYLGNTCCVREPRYKYVTRNQGFGPNELWDLKPDPTEHRNRTGDPALAGVTDRLRGELVDWLRRHGEKWAVPPFEEGRV